MGIFCDQPAAQVVVASGDRALSDSVTSHGAFITPARYLVDEVKKVGKAARHGSKSCIADSRVLFRHYTISVTHIIVCKFVVVHRHYG